MSAPSYRLAKLAAGYDLAAFDCGDPKYNLWLTEHAMRSMAAGASMVYVLLESGTETAEKVVGYFAICPTLVVRDDMPQTLRRGVMRSAPGWLLAKLALDRSLRGDKTRQWGWQLLREALETIAAASDLAGGQVIVVDADNDGLVDWYAKHGFIPTGKSSLRLYMKVATAKKYLDPQN